MAIVVNRSGHDIHFEAYDANSQRMRQDAPLIPTGHSRYVNTDHVGSADYFYMLAFYKSESFRPPPGISMVQGVEGGAAGISIVGTGVSIAATVTYGYSQPVAAAKIGIHQAWSLRALSETEVCFDHDSAQDDPKKRHGW